MPLAGFTNRELQVIALRSQGVKARQISKQLGISYDVVHNHLSRIYRKLGINDVALLTRWAMQNALDEILPPETAETQPEPKPRIRRC